MAENVREALSASTASPLDVAEAANVTVPELESRLDGREDFNIAELVRVGGFLRLDPADLLRGAA